MSQVVVAEFNELFPGIPIPSISGVTLTQVAIRAMAGRLSLSLDLNISKATRSQTAVHSEAPTVAPPHSSGGRNTTVHPHDKLDNSTIEH